MDGRGARGERGVRERRGVGESKTQREGRGEGVARATVPFGFLETGVIETHR